VDDMIDGAVTMKLGGAATRTGLSGSGVVTGVELLG
jgi:hypothetical protein